MFRTKKKILSADAMDKFISEIVLPLFILSSDIKQYINLSSLFPIYSTKKLYSDFRALLRPKLLSSKL